jgi:hypothetical protein
LHGTSRNDEESDMPAEKPDHEDEQHQKFREALERKKAAGHDTPVHATTNKGVGEAHNDHTRREFRRKAGS